MNEDVRKQIHAYIRQYFYYLEYPEPVADGFWKDAEGRLESIMSMTDEQIRECIDRVRTDLYRFEGVMLEPTQKKALAILSPMAEGLRSALEEELEYRQEEAQETQRLQDLEFKRELARRAPPPRAAPDPQQPIALSAKLPRWMVERIRSEGEPDEVLESYLIRGGLRPDGGTTSEPEGTAPPSGDGPVIPVAPLTHALDSILRFTQLALAYDFPKPAMVNYMRLIEKTALRIKVLVHGSTEENRTTSR
jgi:hypothetical protein